jgi:parallel beta-helix repeat protein
MSILISAVFAIATLPGIQAIDLSRVRILSTSGRIQPKSYDLPTVEPYDEKRSGSIQIRGNNLVVDFQGAELLGTPKNVEPDERKGTGIFVSGNNITILNAKVRGYKIGIQARNCEGLKLINCDFSYNWKPRLLSTLEREDLSDWMSYHHNENDEWLRYGAGIYLRGCNGFEVKGCKAEGGGNGLMLMESNRGKVWNNSFSFLSAIGLGMYKSSENRIMHNKIDWCVRGFSYGVYNRGQDSAGILIYEQSNKNIFAYNSVTHGGDGFFLWAGQTTMDTGQGGCNDNLLYGNDFSHAPTNGIEATFSRNNFVNNLVMECWHGIWGGYSYESKIIGNVFGYNAEAIAIEHGQDNVIDQNMFHRDNTGVHLWFNDAPPDPTWGYPKHRDTRSRDYKIASNLFEDTRTNALQIVNSVNVDIDSNLVQFPGRMISVTGKSNNVVLTNNLVQGQPEAMDVSGAITKDGNKFTGGRAPLPPASSMNQGDVTRYSERFHLPWLPNPSLVAPSNPGGKIPREAQPFTVKPMPGGMNPFLKADALRGWRYMLVDQWGPYDFKSPLLWPREATALGGGMAIDSNGKQTTGTPTFNQRFEVLGPKGRWKLISKSGYTSVSAESGSVPGFIEAKSMGKQANKVALVLEYTGAATTDYRGVVTPAGKPVRFGFEKFFAPIDWTIKFYKWSVPENPSDVHSAPKEDALRAIFQGPSLKSFQSDRLDFAGYSFDKVTGNDHYATVAEGSFEVPAGTYTIELTTDDGARVWLDGKPLIEDAWKYQGPTAYQREVKLGAGKHTLKVEHFQIDGYAALKLAIKPKK